MTSKFEDHESTREMQIKEIVERPQGKDDFEVRRPRIDKGNANKGNS